MIERGNLIKRLHLVLAAVAALSLIAAGCGDEAGGDDGTITTSSLNKTAYVKQVNRTCKEMDEGVSKKSVAFFKDEGLSRQSSVKAAEVIFIPNAEAQLDRISEFGAPKGDEDQVEAILTSTEEGLDELKEPDEKAAVAPPPKLKRADELALQYGLDSCTFGI